MALVKFKHSPNWYSRFKIDGQNYQKTLKTTNKKLAEKLDQQFYQEVLAGLHNISDKSSITVEQALDGYGQSKLLDKNIAAGVQFFKNWLPTNKIVKLTDPISAVTTSVLESVVKTRKLEGKADGTVLQTVGFLTRMVKWAKKNGYQVADIEPPKIRVKNGRLRYLSVEEEIRLLAELNPERNITTAQQHNSTYRFQQDNYDLAVILLDTAARVSEITSLRWSDIDLKSGTLSLHRAKVDNESVIFMTDRVMEIMRRRFTQRTTQFLFNDSEGGPKRATRGIHRAMVRAGLDDCVIHTLRHTAASRLVQNGMSLQEVSDILGHSSMQMTSRYAHLCKTDVSKKARDIMNQSSYNNGASNNNSEKYTNSYTQQPVITTAEQQYLDDLATKGKVKFLK